MDIEDVAHEIVDAAIKVHRSLGPGLLESAYQACHVYELKKRGLKVECEVGVPIIYDSMRVDAGYRLDEWVENSILIENKAVDCLLPIHEAQLLTYMKLMKCQIGFLLNWNVHKMSDGIHRRVLGLSGSQKYRTYKLAKTHREEREGSEETPSR